MNCISSSAVVTRTASISVVAMVSSIVEISDGVCSLWNRRVSLAVAAMSVRDATIEYITRIGQMTNERKALEGNGGLLCFEGGGELSYPCFLHEYFLWLRKHRKCNQSTNLLSTRNCVCVLARKPYPATNEQHQRPWLPTCVASLHSGCAHFPAEVTATEVSTSLCRRNNHCNRVFAAHDVATELTLFTCFVLFLFHWWCVVVLNSGDAVSSESALIIVSSLCTASVL